MARKSSGFKNLAGLLFEVIILLFIVTCWSSSDVKSLQEEKKPTVIVAIEQVFLHDGDLRIDGKKTSQHSGGDSDNKLSSFFISRSFPLVMSKGLLMNRFQRNVFYVFLTASAP